MSDKTYPEIRNQYAALGNTIRAFAGRTEDLKQFFTEATPAGIIVTGCGSSYSISKSVASSANLFFGIPAFSVPSGDLMLHADSYKHLLKGALLVVISRSGSTDEIIYAVNRVKAIDPGVRVLSIICTADSRLAAVSDFAVEIPWAFDESVCQTRSVTNLYGASLLVLAAANGDGRIGEELEVLSGCGDAYLDAVEPALQAVVREGWKNVYVLADAEANGIAEEASLAFTEIAFTSAICKHVLDIRHGPIVLIDENSLVLVLLNDEGFDHQEALTASLVARGAKVIVYSAEKLPKEIPGVSAQIVFGHALSPAIAVLPLLSAAQLLAYHSAVSNGLDPDHPSGLDPWIAL
jgi:fructoselysine-6-P-deglycase FrlB-like protein